MSARRLWSRLLIGIGSIAMLAGAADPLEGSLVILPGTGLVTLGTFLGDSGRGLLLEWVGILISIAVGVGSLFILSAWGFGGTSEHSMWWGLLILPYPIAWILGMVSLLFRLIRAVRERHAA
jgi:hypothetical protein